MGKHVKIYIKFAEETLFVWIEYLDNKKGHERTGNSTNNISQDPSV
jgi:hypothetical protein